MARKGRYGILLLALLGMAQAQAGMYRCGNMISDKPCVGEGKTLKQYAAESPPNETQGPQVSGGKLCVDNVAYYITFNDPDSIKIGKVSGGQLEIIDYAGKKLTARAFHVPINQKNQYGAYTGNQDYLCHTSEDGQRILRFVKS